MVREWIGLFAAGTLIAWSAGAALAGQPEPNRKSSAAAADAGKEPKETPPETKGKADSSGPDPTVLRLAERIVALRRAMEADRERLAELKGSHNEQQQEFEKAGSEFRTLDEKRAALQKKLGRLDEDGRKSPAAVKLRQELADVEKQWKLGRERFALTIQARKTLTQRIAALQQKIATDERTIQKLTDPAAAAAQAAPASAGTSPNGTSPNGPPPPAGNGQPVPAKDENGLDKTPPEKQSPTGNGQEAAGRKKAEKPIDKALAKARLEAEKRQAEVEQAEQEVEQISTRLELVEQSITLARQSREAAQKQIANAEKTLRTLQQQLQKQQAAGAASVEVQKTQAAIEEVRRRLSEARDAVEKHNRRLDELYAQRSDLFSERITALEKAETERQKADEAHEKLEALENPFSPRNVLEWLIGHGPRIGLIIIGVIVVRWLVGVISRRLVRSMALTAGRAQGGDRVKWAEFVSRMFYKAGSFVVIAAGALLLLAEVGFPIAPLWTMVSAVLAMVAIGFVAVWSVLSNTLCSLMLLVYQPFTVGSRIELAASGVGGKVINFNLLFTTLRTDEGDLIEVPNNTFFQGPIRHREGKNSVSLSEQLTKEENTE